MLGYQPNVNSKGAEAQSARAASRDRLLGYVLTTRQYDPGHEAVTRLQRKCMGAGFALAGTEWDVGYASNPYRVGLWRVLRRLVCDTCEIRRMPFSLANFEDFIEQALKPCICRSGKGLDGIVVSKLDHISSEPKKGTMLVMRLALAGKHVIADDGICLSCCHPAMKQLLNKN